MELELEQLYDLVVSGDKANISLAIQICNGMGQHAQYNLLVYTIERTMEKYLRGMHKDYLLVLRDKGYVIRDHVKPFVLNMTIGGKVYKSDKNMYVFGDMDFQLTLFNMTIRFSGIIDLDSEDKFTTFDVSESGISLYAYLNAEETISIDLCELSPYRHAWLYLLGYKSQEDIINALISWA